MSQGAKKIFQKTFTAQAMTKQTEQVYGSNINATGDTSNTRGVADGKLLANESN